MNRYTIRLAFLFFAIMILSGEKTYSQTWPIVFGHTSVFSDITAGSSLKEQQVKWYNVNTKDDTWRKEGEVLISTGHPIGVIRSEKQYENFILHLEWRHMEAGGNSGVFVWCDAKADDNKRLPDGVEIQILELDWVNLNTWNGEKPPVAFVHGEVFGVGDIQTVPDNPRIGRSMSVENRCKGKGEWNTYTAVCVDGTIKLSVNGKYVNGLSKASRKKGYICLESEGAEIEFRNLRIVELDAGVTSPEQIYPIVD